MITVVKKSINLLFPFVRKIYVWYKIRERKVSYGKENADKTFYVIGCSNKNGGLWWQINKVLMHIAYAEDHGYIPVVDLKNHSTQYTEESTKGKVNVWELFFKQPAGYSLDDISQSKNVIINKMDSCPAPQYYMGQDTFYDDPVRLEYFRKLYHKYIKFSDQTKSYLDAEYNRLFKDKGKIIGVLCRGTDYITLKPKGHPIQPDSSMVIEDVKRAMKEYGANYVFLATEDQDILDDFLKVFGDKLLYIDQHRISKSQMKGNEYLSDTIAEYNKNIDPFHRGIQYFSATYLLSICDIYIGGRTGGSKGTLLMTKGFEYQKIYDLGIYE